MLQERASGRCQRQSSARSARTPVGQEDCRERLALGGQRARSPSKPFPGASGEEVLICRRVKALHVARDGCPGKGTRVGLGAPARCRGGEAAAAVVLGTSPGEVPQLFPANCFTYVLEKDMALSFRNHSSAQWVQQGANTCETPTEAAPSPFLKHFFVCIQGNRLQAYLIQFSLCTIHI